jgi:hypothetical protein
MAHVVVRDGRNGLPPELVTLVGGDVLDEFSSDGLFGIGDLLRLPDGTQVQVVEIQEIFSGSEHTQILTVGDC